MEIIVIIAVIAIIVVFIFKMNKNKKLTPELERFKNELEKIHEETGITDIYALAEIKRINDTKKILDDLNKEKNDGYIQKKYKHEISFRLAGLFYRSEAAKDEAMCLNAGDKVKLRHDANNVNDTFAVKIISNNKFIGFVPAFLSRDVTMFMCNYPDFKAEVIKSTRFYNEQFAEIDLDIEFKAYSDKDKTKIDKTWLNGKQIILSGYFKLIDKKEVADFITFNGGTVRRYIGDNIDLVILGTNNIKNLDAIMQLVTKHKRLIVLKEDEILELF